MLGKGTEHSTLGKILVALDNLARRTDAQDTFLQELLTKVKDTPLERDKILVKLCYNEERRETSSTSKANQICVLAEEAPRKFTELGMSLTEAFIQLQQTGYLQPLEPRPEPVNKLPKWSAKHLCRFHQARGHQTDKCFRLKHEIHNLIDVGTVIVTLPPQR